MRQSRLAGAALAVLALLLGACAPVAQVLVDAIETSDGATLTYILSSQEGGPGLAFDPGPQPARSVIVRAEGDTLQLLSVPDGATCTVTTNKLDCRLGNRDAPVTIGVSGTNVAASATWRRATSSVYLTFARLPGEDAP